MVSVTWDVFWLLAVAQFIGTGLYVTDLTDKPEVPDVVISLLLVVAGAIVSVLFTPQWGTIVMLGGAAANT